MILATKVSPNVRSQLSSTDHNSDEGSQIRVIGWLFPSTADRLRILIGDLCIDFSIDGIRAIKPIVSQWPATSKVAIHAEVEFTETPRVLWLGPSAPLQQFFRTGPRPFALATRQIPPPLEGHEDYRKLEAAYMFKNGISISQP